MQYAYVEGQYCSIPFKLTNILQNKLWSYHRLRIVLDRTFVSRTSNFKPLSKPAKSPKIKPDFLPYFPDCPTTISETWTQSEFAPSKLVV